MTKIFVMFCLLVLLFISLIELRMERFQVVTFTEEYGAERIEDATLAKYGFYWKWSKR